MIGTEEQAMKDETRGRGASFSAAECGMLEAALAVAEDAHEARVARGAAEPLSPDMQTVVQALRDKCARGAGL